jgi:carboxylesterase 2
VQGVAALNSSVADYVDNWANISFFGGIPFGVSTAGANRFAPPQPVAPWNITLDASTFGPICPTSNQQISTYPMSEDCLSVNIWTPATSADDKLPVAFWSYGDGTAAPQAQFNGGGVAGKGIVFVTYNYRNGALGFFADPSLPEVTSSNATGNWGVLDQYLALKWAHDNIAAFGGDPDHITVMGQSFGSAATFHIVNSNLTTGLGIVGAISESGVRSPNDVMTSEIATWMRRWRLVPPRSPILTSPLLTRLALFHMRPSSLAPAPKTRRLSLYSTTMPFPTNTLPPFATALLIRCPTSLATTQASTV